MTTYLNTALIGVHYLYNGG